MAMVIKYHFIVLEVILQSVHFYSFLCIMDVFYRTKEYKTVSSFVFAVRRKRRIAVVQPEKK